MLIIQIALGIVFGFIIVDLIVHPYQLLWISKAAWYGFKILCGAIGFAMVGVVFLSGLMGIFNASFLQNSEIKLLLWCSILPLAINSIGKKFSLVWSLSEDEKNEEKKPNFANLDF